MKVLSNLNKVYIRAYQNCVVFDSSDTYYYSEFLPEFESNFLYSIPFTNSGTELNHNIFNPVGLEVIPST